MIIVRDNKGQVIAFSTNPEYVKLYLEKFLIKGDNEIFTIEERPDSELNKYSTKYGGFELTEFNGTNAICTAVECCIWEDYLVTQYESKKHSITQILLMKGLSGRNTITGGENTTAYLDHLYDYISHAIPTFDEWLFQYGEDSINELMNNRFLTNSINELNNEFLRKMEDERE